jgi:hypothetical protein
MRFPTKLATQLQKCREPKKEHGTIFDATAKEEKEEKKHKQRKKHLRQ